MDFLEDVDLPLPPTVDELQDLCGMYLATDVDLPSWAHLGPPAKFQIRFAGINLYEAATSLLTATMVRDSTF